MPWLKYISVITIASLKFMGGPITGVSLKLGWLETAICTIVGMMLTVALVTLLGEFIQSVDFGFSTDKKKKSPFNRRNRWAIKIRQRLGLWGLAFLTPVLFTPPFGAALAVAFRYSKQEIFFKMFVSALVWAALQVYFFYYLKTLF